MWALITRLIDPIFFFYNIDEMINTIKTDIQLTSRGVEVWITTSVSCFLISTSSSVELRLRLCLDIKGKKVRGKIVKGMKMNEK